MSTANNINFYLSVTFKVTGVTGTRKSKKIDKMKFL